ncbi:hypothetical protein B7Y94_00260 [Candidatus Saccharibacteria bacterium 32-49-12]|nr:MAG: hypothetical protein B7Y94_00260 [Candidatus Saccharibacteria bacterium 32-49-12]
MAKKRIVGIIIAIFVVLGVGLTIWAFQSDSLKGKLAGGKVSSIFGGQGVVCADKIIADYNDALAKDTYDEQDVLLKTLLTKVESTPNYESDATCQFIRYKAYQRQGAISKVKDVASKLELLVEDGKYPSLNLDNIESMSRIKEFIGRYEESEAAKQAGGAG